MTAGLWVEQTLWNAMMPSELLTLEVTETMEMRDWKKAKRIIDDLKAAGCKIAIDDFGTGFSSLAYLRAMKAHELKIDRSLLTGLEHSAEARLLLRSVLEMAHNLHLCVTIEGIETEWQAQLVCDMGAENAQGFWYGRPVSPDEALKNAMTANSRIEPCRTSGRSIGSN
ncbi:MAG: EAL domain-containing protein [Pseudomonadota bacterium]